MAERKKLLLIYNHKAGKALINSSLSSVCDIFTKAGYDVMVRPTQSKTDAYSSAKNRAGEFDLVVVAGGDGTLEEVAGGVYDSGFKTPIGCIPSGSTNDFASSLKIPKSITGAAKYIAAGKPHEFDLGRFNDKKFIYIAAFGWFTDVSYMTDQTLKNIFGRSAYIMEAGKRLFTIPEYHLKIKANHRNWEGSFVYGMVTNSRSVGGLKDIGWKNVDMDDGLFEVTFIRTPKTLVEFSEAAACLVSGEPCDHILKVKTQKIEIECKEELKWTIDGEDAGVNNRVVIENISKAVQIIVQ